MTKKITKNEKEQLFRELHNYQRTFNWYAYRDFDAQEAYHMLERFCECCKMYEFTCAVCVEEEQNSLLQKAVYLFPEEYSCMTTEEFYRHPVDRVVSLIISEEKFLSSQDVKRCVFELLAGLAFFICVNLE